MTASSLQKRRRERGAALLVMLFVLVVAWTATLLVAVALATDLRAAREDRRRTELAVLVDSALAESLAALALDRYATGFGWHDLGAGEIAATIGDVNGDFRTVHAWARAGGAQRAIVATVQLRPARPVVVAWRQLPLAAAGAR